MPVAKVLQGIHNSEYVLPAIQREFVWKTEQIRSLFDSLMRGYPSSPIRDGVERRGLLPPEADLNHAVVVLDEYANVSRSTFRMSASSGTPAAIFRDRWNSKQLAPVPNPWPFRPQREGLARGIVKSLLATSSVRQDDFAEVSRSV